uniref:Uncharacterized protein n=1 Tax=Rhizophora mucronata TaxID=61149 RepID=A0A2P2PFZ8_RHIMU
MDSKGVRLWIGQAIGFGGKLCDYTCYGDIWICFS